MTVIALVLLAAWCAALSVVDIRFRQLPNRLTGFGGLAVLGYALTTGHFAIALLGAALLAGPYLLVHLAAPTALGAGDVKLAVGLGAVAALGGPHVWVWAALGAPMLTACIAAGVVVTRRIDTSRGGESSAPVTVPHGPAMCVTTLLALCSSIASPS
ncbi:A24 family peptidase [Nocardia sp. CNY236]|uniref:prepilin peptidase n=1 Tax=Nocardia sp. CNY236 TaxID=1169152 RepID=UPI0004292192|nr:A24 family peptidase [Nocardia sp. CNY236]